MKTPVVTSAVAVLAEANSSHDHPRLFNTVKSSHSDAIMTRLLIENDSAPYSHWVLDSSCSLEPRVRTSKTLLTNPLNHLHEAISSHDLKRISR